MLVDLLVLGPDAALTQDVLQAASDTTGSRLKAATGK
jgi:hypothetical protein